MGNLPHISSNAIFHSGTSSGAAMQNPDDKLIWIRPLPGYQLWANQWAILQIQWWVDKVLDPGRCCIV